MLSFTAALAWGGGQSVVQSANLWVHSQCNMGKIVKKAFQSNCTPQPPSVPQTVLWGLRTCRLPDLHGRPGNRDVITLPIQCSAC